MITIPDINPIRFYQDRIWNYNTDFPTEDNLPSTITDKNIGVVAYIQPWATNNELPFQLHQDKTDNVEVSVYVDGVKTILTGVDITPANWGGNGNYVMLYKYTPTSTGCIHFRISEEVLTGKYEYYKSDNIQVKTSLPRCKRIEYYNSTSLLNAVFTLDGTRVFFPIIFLEGTNVEPLVGGEKSTSPTPSGMIRNLRSSPTKGSKLMIDLLPKTFVNKLQMILSCDSLLINGIYYQSPDNLEPGYIQGSNSNNTSVDIFQTNSNYACTYISVYDVEPHFYSDLDFWFKKVGTTYVDQISGLIIQESGGYINFNPSLSTDAKFFIFDRTNFPIQTSALAPDYDPTKPYAYATEIVAQNLTGGAKTMVDWYNFGYMGRIYIKDNREEIIVYKTDKGLLDDEACLEYIFKDSYATDGGFNVLIDSKYNLIDF